MTIQSLKNAKQNKFLRWINLRKGEGERTFWMFAFYTTTSSGLAWLEASAVDLFLGEYGAIHLPLIYLASSVIKIGLGLLYSLMQRFLPLRSVIVLIALLIAAPLPVFWFGLRNPIGVTIAGFSVLRGTVLLMQLWLEASHALNDLNASITANQLFNVREVKRTYPLISSGILVADVVSGFSLPLLLKILPRGHGLPTVILASFVLMLIGAGILFYLSQTNQQSFPDARWRRDERRRSEAGMPRIRGPMRRYMTVLRVFFGLGQVFLLLVEFQFLSQLEFQQSAFAAQTNSGDIAGFLGLFNGLLGICELAMQWLFSSRVIDRMGAFSAVMVLPVMVMLVSGTSMTGMIPVFIGVLVLRFLYELLHYTLFSSVGPFLFYSLPEHLRDREQARVRGIAEPIATAVTGLVLLGFVSLSADAIKSSEFAGHTFIFGLMILLAVGWLVAIAVLRRQYVELLVLNAERGQLSSSDVDLRVLRQAVIEKLEKPGAEADKRSCIELLSQIDAKNIGESLAPLLPKLSPVLQHKSLEVMLTAPNSAHLTAVKALFEEKPAPEVMALSLRYIWLTESFPRVDLLRKYLKPEIHPIVRGTAASLLLRQGTPTQKAEATNTLRLMLNHKQKQERVMGCRALGDALYLQALRLYIPNLLQDPSLSVRCAILEAIGATRLEEYYPSLLKGLHFKPTREASKKALVRLENDALPMLVNLADNIHLSDLVRGEALSAIGQIGTSEAIEHLIARLHTAWGNQRRTLLRILFKIPQERGIETVLDRLGRQGIEQLIEQELMLIGQIYAALADLIPERVRGQEADLLRRSLTDAPSDSIERLFLLMKFLYPASAIQAASFNIQSGSRSNVAQGLEILDNTLDISSKRAFLAVFDRDLITDKLQSLSDLVPYTPMRPHDRVKYLLELRHFISDWSLSCCFHLAGRARWSLTSDQIEGCLGHPRGFVREAVLSYLKLASPKVLVKILPRFEHDRNSIVVKQVNAMMKEFGVPSALQESPEAPNKPRHLRTI
jgi:HEAT repeat protein